eukprot:GILK01000466.1.p1 GENE.GILK01000466.1~~GILK01000466.1.p1  ORF type:complete len:501 (+),score=64.30 GILK01000466.1:180-1682(+)
MTVVPASSEGMTCSYQVCSIDHIPVASNFFSAVTLDSFVTCLCEYQPAVVRSARASCAASDAPDSCLAQPINNDLSRQTERSVSPPLLGQVSEEVRSAALLDAFSKSCISRSLANKNQSNDRIERIAIAARASHLQQELPKEQKISLFTKALQQSVSSRLAAPYEKLESTCRNYQPSVALQGQSPSVDVQATAFENALKSSLLARVAALNSNLDKIESIVSSEPPVSLRPRPTSNAFVFLRKAFESSVNQRLHRLNSVYETTEAQVLSERTPYLQGTSTDKQMVQDAWNRAVQSSVHVRLASLNQKYTSVAAATDSVRPQVYLTGSLTGSDSSHALASAFHNSFYSRLASLNDRFTSLSSRDDINIPLIPLISSAPQATVSRALERAFLASRFNSLLSAYQQTSDNIASVTPATLQGSVSVDTRTIVLEKLFRTAVDTTAELTLCSPSSSDKAGPKLPSVYIKLGEVSRVFTVSAIRKVFAGLFNRSCAALDTSRHTDKM